MGCLFLLQRITLPDPGIEPLVSRVAGRLFMDWATREENKGMDSEKWSTAKMTLLMTVLKDCVSSWQAHPGRLQQAIYSLNTGPTPWFLIGWVLWCVQSSWTLPKFHHFFTGYPFFSFANLTSAFFNKEFLVSLSLLPTSCLLKNPPGTWTMSRP